jgi:hypothetical protein
MKTEAEAAGLPQGGIPPAVGGVELAGKLLPASPGVLEENAKEGTLFLRLRLVLVSSTNAEGAGAQPLPL